MVGRTARRHKLFSEAAKRWERGVDPAAAAGRARPGGRAADHVRRRRRRRRRARLRPRAAAYADRTGASTCPRGGPACRTSRPGSSALLEAVGCTVTVDGDRLSAPSRRPGGPTSPTRPTWSRRSSGSTATTTCRAVLPLAPPGRGLTDAQRRRRSVARALAETGYVEVLVLPVRRSASARRARAARRRPAAGAWSGWPTRCPTKSRYLRTTLLPPLLATLRRNVGRGARDIALYELGVVFLARPGAGAPPVDGRRRPAVGRVVFAAADAVVPAQPWHVAVVLAGEVEPAGWWGAGRPASWADAVEAARDRARRRGHPRRAGDASRAGGAGAVAPGPLRRDRRRRRRSSARRRAAPGRGARRWSLPKRTAAVELDLDAVPAAPVTPAPRVSGFPPALIDVALVVGGGVPAADVRAGARAEGAGELLESVRLFDVYAVGAARRGPQVARLQADLPRAGPHADRRGGGRGPRRGGRRRPPSRFGATLRGA